MCSARTCQTDVNSLHISMPRFCLEIVSAHDSSVAAGMINARSETASTKPAFRDALKFAAA